MGFQVSGRGLRCKVEGLGSLEVHRYPDPNLPPSPSPPPLPPPDVKCLGIIRISTMILPREAATGVYIKLYLEDHGT